MNQAAACPGNETNRALLQLGLAVLCGMGALCFKAQASESAPVGTATNLAPTGAARTVPPQPASNRKMAETLARIRDTADPRSMAYMSDRLVIHLKSALALATNAQQQVPIRFQLGF